MSSPPWKARFFTIWTGQTFSLIGSALVQFALIWWLTETTGSAAVLATASLVGLLPPVLLGPFVGTLVDRWRRRWILVAADGAIALFTAVLAVLYWQGRLKLRFRSSAPDRETKLLRAIANLDDDHEVGRVDEETYRAKRAKLKDELVELMQVEKQSDTIDARSTQAP